METLSTISMAARQNHRGHSQAWPAARVTLSPAAAHGYAAARGYSRIFAAGSVV